MSENGYQRHVLVMEELLLFICTDMSQNKDLKAPLCQTIKVYRLLKEKVRSPSMKPLHFVIMSGICHYRYWMVSSVWNPISTAGLRVKDIASFCVP